MKKHATRLLAGLLSLAMLCPNAAMGSAMVRNGGSFAYAVREDGTIVGWGDNRMGQLGTKPNKVLNTPVDVADELNGALIADIQCGNENALFLMKDGTVYTCGTYSRGTQGLGKIDTIVSKPAQIPDLSGITQISCGFGHNAALDSEGHLWIWGRNDHGQLGLGDKTARNVPVMMELEHITAVSCGGKFTIAMDEDGRFWGWGSNEYLVLENSRVKDLLMPTELSGLDGIETTAFSAGSDCAFWLDGNGDVWGRGRNEYRQTGSPDAEWRVSPNLTRVDIPEKVVDVCAYSATTAALTENGNVYIWGSTSAGQLGNGTLPNATFPVLAWDRGDAVEIAMGSLFSSVLTKDGKVYITGYNKYGQLGNGTNRTLSEWVWNGTTLSEP